MQLKKDKFSDPKVTESGDPRAFVDLKTLETLWFNTGTLCNLACENCYIESTPKNDRLVYITVDEVREYLDEIMQERLPTREIAFTGGEPFMNPDFMKMLSECLFRGFNVLVLTNAMRPMEKCADDLLSLRDLYGSRLSIRVSVDHFSKHFHEQERGTASWNPMMKGLKWLSDHDFNISAAGRTRWGETESDLRAGFATLFQKETVKIDAYNRESLILFPEMDENAEIPEITTACWGILGVKPEDMMCATSRMVVKRKGSDKPAVLACTLLAYEDEFELGNTLKKSHSRVYLNHKHCAKFCVLGGGSCSVS